MRKKRIFTEKRMANIFRWWSAGALYFFIGWGTGLGVQTSTIDFVFFLGIGIALFEMLIVNPVVNSMFNLPKPVKLSSKSLMWRVLYRLGYIGKTMIILILVVLIYRSINYMAILSFGLDPLTVVLPGEPILFGIFYIIIYTLFQGLTKNVSKRLKEIE